MEVCNKIGHYCVAIIKGKKERERLGPVGRRDCMGTEGREIEFEGGPE